MVRDIRNVVCAFCDTHLTTVVDWWLPFDPNHLLPAVPPSTHESWEISDISYHSKSGSFEECNQDLFQCKVCGKVLGVRCSKSPIETNLPEGQLAFFRSSVIVRSPSNTSISANPPVQLDSGSSNGSSSLGARHDAQPPTQEVLCTSLAAKAIDNLTKFEPDTPQRWTSDLIITKNHGSTGINDTISRIQKQTPLLTRPIDDAWKDEDTRRDGLGLLNTEMASLREQLAEMWRE